jgi:glucokinase
MSHHMYAAIDIGGTKLAAGLVRDDGELLRRVELPTPAHEPAEYIFATVEKLLDTLAAEPMWAQVSGVGVGSAGPLDPKRGTVSPVNIPAWRDFPLIAQIAAHPAVASRSLPVELTGDASAMAVGEHWRGAARGYDHALCLVVSTGVGAGLILDGAARTGPSGNAGHLGHISVELDGEDCPCGSRGCLETIASGTAIARWAVNHGWRPGAAPAGCCTPPANPTRRASAADVAASASSGNEIALAAFERAGRALAAGIAAVTALLDVQVAVIGGGVAKAGPILFDPLHRHLKRYAALPFTRDLAVTPAALGDDAGLIGAAAAIRLRTGPRR